MPPVTAGNSTQIVNNPVMKRVAGIGFLVYGGLYVLVGALAAKVAFGTGGRITSSKGAIVELAREPFGGVFMIVVMVGLFAYSTWRFMQVITNPEGHRGATGLVIRGGRLVSSVSYGALAVFTLRIVTGVRRTGGDSNWALRLVTEPLGAVVGTLIGLVIVGAGVAQFYKAYTADFGEPMHHSEMTRPERTWGHYAGRLGFSARAVVFTMIGGYLLYAVFDANPNRAKSVDALLVSLLRLPYGSWILGLVALGLASYGMFMILVAIHRKHPY
jgi:hypothetical protein